MTARKTISWMACGLLTVFVAGCDSGATDPVDSSGEAEVATLLHVTPVGGSVDVDPTAPVILEFDHPIHPLMVGYASLHEGDLDGPEVAGSWSLSEGGTQLVFTQNEPLQPATTYVIHIGGAMYDVHGHEVDIEHHGPGMGGEWAWEGMFEHMGQRMGHRMGMGDDFEHPHMDDDWRHENGAYGMVFSFTTAN